MEREFKIESGELCYNDLDKTDCIFQFELESINGAFVRNLDLDCNRIIPIEYLYKYVDGLKSFDGHRVCYEHNEMEDEYPYYCPDREENMFTFECVEG